MIATDKEIPKDVERKILNAAEDARKIYCGSVSDSVGACIETAQWISRHSSTSLKKSNIEHNIVHGNFICDKKSRRHTSHTWIEFPSYDNAILDVTADQFGDFPHVWFPADKKCYIAEKSNKGFKI